MGPPLWIYEDHGRQLALIRGQLPTVKEALAAAGEERSARWSTAARGWVLPLAAMPDLRAAAEVAGIGYRIKVVDG